MRKIVNNKPLFMICFFSAFILAQEENAADSAAVAFFKDTTWLATVQGKAKLQLDTWTDYDSLSPYLSIYIRPAHFKFQPLAERLSLPSGLKLKPSEIPFSELRSSTAYQVELAQTHIISEHLKSAQVMVSPFTLLGLAYKAGEKWLPGLFKKKTSIA